MKVNKKHCFSQLKNSYDITTFDSKKSYQSLFLNRKKYREGIVKD